MGRRYLFKNYDGSPSDGEVLSCDGGTSPEIMMVLYPPERYFHAMERLFHDLAKYLRLINIVLGVVKINKRQIKIAFHNFKLVFYASLATN